MQQFSYFCKNVNCHSVDSNLGAMSSPLSQTATNLCSRPADFHSFIFVGFLGFERLKSASLLADYQSNKTCFQSYARWKAVEY